MVLCRSTSIIKKRERIGHCYVSEKSMSRACRRMRAKGRRQIEILGFLKKNLSIVDRIMLPHDVHVLILIIFNILGYMAKEN